MPKKFFGLLIGIIFLIAPIAQAAALPTVAVLPFHKKAAVSAELTLEDEDYAAELVNEHLTNSGRFDVVDREYLSDALREQAFGLSGAVDPSTAAQLGKIVGAQYIVVGSINGLSLVNKVGKVAGVGGKSFKVVAHISARMVEVETGRVIAASSGKGESTAHRIEAPLRLIRIGTEDISQEQVYDAIDKATAELSKKMLSALENRG